MTNPFLKIVKESSSKQIMASSRYWILIKDIYPVARVHLLFLLKRKQRDLLDPSFLRMEWNELLLFLNLIKKIFFRGKISGLRVSFNEGSKQEIPHLHIHLLFD